MSLFDDFCESNMDAAFGIFGESYIQIEGASETVSGVVNQFQAEKELAIGGKIGMFSATVVLRLFDMVALFGQPLERTVTGRKATIEGRKYKVGAVEVDTVSVTLALENEVK
jgi:hypothetical protein